MDNKEIKKLVKSLTLEEKAGLCSGFDYWHTKAVKDKNIPDVMVSDGPNGLRKMDLDAQVLDMNNSIKAVCFPNGCALAASFDKKLAHKMGERIGREAMAEELSTVLGPAINIKRSPLCGRNFEYLSEDPYHAGAMAAEFIDGIQSVGAFACPKHFATNNQENMRNTQDSVVEERALREIYLKPFEMAVRNGKARSIMCSYNILNGVQVSENKRLLTEILRDDWGFDGVVMSDWGAVKDRAKGIAAGLDLEMPGNGGKNDKVIVDAVRSGELDEADLDKSVERILSLVFDAHENRTKYLADNNIRKASDPKNKKEHFSGTDTIEWDKHSDHVLARDLAKDCIVLLKNENKVLPLDDSDYVTIIGEFAKVPRFQGGGSAHINIIKSDSLILALQGNSHTKYAKGFSATSDEYDEIAFNKALEQAKGADKVVVCAGLPDEYESESYDREHIELPKVQNDLIEELCKCCQHVIVVLQNGSAVAMPWIDKVDAVVEAFLGGEGVGCAIADILYGRANPSARLPETFINRIEDNPAYLEFGGNCETNVYREGIFVGYRYYASKHMPVLFPFGYGLSYTHFSYGPIKCDCDSIIDNDSIEVKVDVTNDGDCFGKEVVQLYISKKDSKIRRPVRELKAFDKIALDAGERTTVTFTLGKEAFAYYDEGLKDWYTEGGEYDIEICKNAYEVILAKTISVYPANPKPVVYTVNSTIKDVLADGDVSKIMQKFIDEKMSFMKNEIPEAAREAISDKAMQSILDNSALRMIVNMSYADVSVAELNALIDDLNKAKSRAAGKKKN